MKRQLDNFSPAWLENDEGTEYLLPLQVIEAEIVAALLKALANPTRLEIVSLLTYGSTTVSSLATALDQTQPNISKHLRILREAGFVRAVIRGSERIYELTRANFATAVLDLAAQLDD